MTLDQTFSPRFDVPFSSDLDVFDETYIKEVRRHLIRHVGILSEQSEMTTSLMSGYRVPASMLDV